MNLMSFYQDPAQKKFLHDPFKRILKDLCINTKKTCRILAVRGLKIFLVRSEGPLRCSQRPLKILD